MAAVERLLLAQQNTAAGGESVLGSIEIAVMPIVKVFTMCALGLLMASKYVDILHASGRKLLNGLVFTLLLPCLIFSQLGQAVTLQKMLDWWFIPVNVVLGSVAGSIIGFVVATIIRPPYPYFKFTIIQIGIGNIGNVPLVLISALCRDQSNPFGDSEQCSKDGTAYISFGQWVGAIILYTYVFNMLAPPPEGTFDIDNESVPLKSTPMGDATPEQIPLLVREDGVSSTSQNTSKKWEIKGLLAFVYEKLKLKQVLQPLSLLHFAYVLQILAMTLGAVPFFKQLIFTPDAPLFFFTDSCMILGEAMIPCILLALGGNLIDGPGSSKLGFRTTAAIVFARLVLVPPVGLGIVMLADKFGFLPLTIRCFGLSCSFSIQCQPLYLQHNTGSSWVGRVARKGAVASLRGCGRDAAAVLFWVHIFAIFSMAIWIILFLYILF
ncbi:hypothetical protein ACSQ67_016151 [Phaseolus vulgaris]